MKSFLKFIIAAALLPFAAASAFAFVKLLYFFNNPTLLEYFFLGGFASYFLFELMFSKPLRTYVLGHELSHVFASLLCGGMPKKIRVSKKGGSVTLSKSNFFISLAPYMFPIYTILIILVYYITNMFYPIENYQAYFAGLVGVSTAFHIRLTVFAISQDQPDLKTTGKFFSLVLIIFVNFILLAALLKLLFPSAIILKSHYLYIWEITVKIYMQVYYWLSIAANSVADKIS